MKTGRKLTFLDETPELDNIYDRTVDRNSSRPTSQDAVDEEPHSANADFQSDVQRPQSKRTRLMTSDLYTGPAGSTPTQLASADVPFDPTSWIDEWAPGPIDFRGLDAIITHSLPHFNRILHNNGRTAMPSDSLAGIYLSNPAWPLHDKEVAVLLRYYVENLAHNFDLTDPLRHFGSVVPQRASVCPPLLNAICALSARHKSRVDNFDPLISSGYIQRCLQHLIPILDDREAFLDENVLASIIILRHVEEFEVPLTGQQPTEQQSHLLGAHAFITAQQRVPVSGGLRQAAFWVGLRQEIYVAFVNQRSIIPALEHCNVDRSFDAATEDVWACRMVVLCADVIRYCFGDQDRSLATFKFLEDFVFQWDRRKPAAFMPVYREAPDETKDPPNVFEELWFVGDAVVTGLQNYCFAKILLSAHDPRIPRLGPARATALRAADEEIKKHVRLLCAMCLSNPSTPPNFM